MAGPTYNFPLPEQTPAAGAEVLPVMMMSFAMRRVRLAQMQAPEPKKNVAPRPGQFVKPPSPAK